MFPARTAYFVALFPRHNYGGKKSTLPLWSSESSKKEIRRQGEVGGMEKESKEGNFLPFLLLFHWTLATSFSGCDVCECVFVLAAAYPPCGILPLMSHSCLLRLQWVHHTHTYVCTSLASPTGNVCFLLRCSFCFPLKAQRRMSSTHAARLKFSLHISVNHPAVIQKRRWSGFQAHLI